MRSSNSGVGLPSLSAGVPRTTMASKVWRLVLACGAMLLAITAQISNAASKPIAIKDRRSPKEYRRGAGLFLWLGRGRYAGRELVFRLIAGNENSSLHCIAKAGGVNSECERFG